MELPATLLEAPPATARTAEARTAENCSDLGAHLGGALHRSTRTNLINYALRICERRMASLRPSEVCLVKIAVLGAGAMGQVTIRDLCESANVSEVLMADLSLERLEALKAQFNKPKLKTAKADVTDIAGLGELLKGWQAVINCSPYIFNLNVMEAALIAGCHYLDLGGLFHVTRKQMELNQKFAEQKLLAVLGMGAAPGMTNVMAACAADEMDTVSSIDIYAASVDLVASNHPFLPPYALDTILDEYFLCPYVFEDGEFKEVPPMSGEHVHDFPQPVGRASSFLTLHSEVATLPLTYKDKGVKRVTYRLGLPTLFHERCKFLVDLGFGDKESMKIGEAELKPRKILQAMIDRHALPTADPDDAEVIRVDVAGTKAGRQILTRLETMVLSHKEWKISCGALDTGVPPSIVAQLICSGEIKQRGVQAPEACVPAQRFFQELAKRNMEMRKITDEVLASSECSKAKVKV